MDSVAVSSIQTVFDGYMCAFANYFAAYESWRPLQCGTNAAKSGNQPAYVYDAPSGLNYTFFTPNNGTFVEASVLHSSLLVF